MTRRSLFQRVAACFVGSVLAKTPFVAAAAQVASQEPERITGWRWIDVTPKQHPSFNIDPVYRKFVLVHDEYAPWP